HDGMPDAWEIAHGLNPYDPSDAALDIDGDGLTNLQEFQLGTDPRDPQSGLHFTSIGLGTNQVLLTFSAAANISYAIQCTDRLVNNGTNNWQQIASFAAVSTNRVITHSVAVDRLSRFYRLVATATVSAQTNLQITSIELAPNNQVSLSLIIPANHI